MSDSRALTTTPEPGGSLLNFVAEAVKNPEIDVTKLEALLRMQREIVGDQAKQEFIAAFTRLSADLPRVKKNGTISLVSKDGKDKGSIAFARWEDMDRVIRPMLVREGFTLSFDSAQRPGDGGGIIVTATLMHRDGYSRTASIPLALDAGPGRNNLQAMGSSLSYGKRYCAEMLLNIVREGEDDDGKLGGTKFITAEEATDLERLITETKSDRARFLQFFGIAALENLTAGQLDGARNMLWEKMNKGAKA